MKLPRASKSLLNLLKQGLTITNEYNWALGGDTDNGYINQYTNHTYQGCWIMDMQGLKNAIADIRKTLEQES